MSKRNSGFLLAASVVASLISGVSRGWAFEQVEASPPPEQILNLEVGVSVLISTDNPVYFRRHRRPERRRCKTGDGQNRFAGSQSFRRNVSLLL